MSSQTQESVTLWGVSASPYVRKVKVALEEKQIPYKQIEILPKILLQALGQEVPGDFDKASPLGKIPTLRVGDFCIADSAVIVAYLDRKFNSGNRLYPSNPENYAKTLWFEHYADVVLTEVAYKKIFTEMVIKPNILKQKSNKTVVEQAQTQELPALLDYLDRSVASQQWIAGDEFSVADIAIATHLLALKMAGFDIKDKQWNHLKSYLEKVASRPSFQRAVFSDH